MATRQRLAQSDRHRDRSPLYRRLHPRAVAGPANRARPRTRIEGRLPHPPDAPLAAHLRSERHGDSLLVRAHLERTGTAAAIGTARGELVDSTGAARATFTTPVAAYYSVDPRFAFPLDSVPPGRYRLRIEITSGRQDLAPDDIVPFKAVRDSMTVQLP